MHEGLGYMAEKREVGFRHMPLCIRLLTVYSLVLMLFYFFFAFTLRTAYIFGLVFQGTNAQLVNIISFFIVAALTYGYYFRKPYGFTLSLWWYSLTILNFFVNVFIAKQPALAAVNDIMKIVFIFIFIINGITLWYIHEKRSYFLHPGRYKHRFDNSDRVFLYMMTLLAFLVIIIMTAITIKFYTETTKSIDTYLENFQDLSAQEAYSYCLSREVQNKDLCLTTLAIIKNTPGMEPICERVESDFYRFTCNYAFEIP